MSYKDKETLEKLYWGERKSTHDIAEQFGVSQRTVVYWMDKHNIERRPIRKAAAEKNRVEYASYSMDSNGYPYWQSWSCGTKYCLHVHQLLAIANGADPYDIFDGKGNTVTHHKNECKFDNRPTNIEVMSSTEHTRRHHQRDEGGDD